jgi:predicted Zn-dependent protease
VTSFDVEQNLIAKAVSAFNLKTNSYDKFGAVNVITDKPKNSFFSASPMEVLTRINREKKAGSRKLAVSVALDALRSAQPIRSGQTVLKFDIPVKINSTPQLKRVRQCVQLLGLAS